MCAGGVRRVVADHERVSGEHGTEHGHVDKAWRGVRAPVVELEHVSVVQRVHGPHLRAIARDSATQMMT